MSDFYTYNSRNEDYCIQFWGPKVTRLNEEIDAARETIKRLDKSLIELQKDAEKGRAFQKILDHINDNETCKDAWDNLLFNLKITDENAK